MIRLLTKTFILIIVCVLAINLVMLLPKDNHSANCNEINVALAHDRLEKLRDKNKIVIIAGSNGSWSINSQMLVNAFHMPVVNTSTAAGIGVRMQFEMFKRYLKSGDIVLFLPEYYGGEHSLYGESTILRILSTHAPSEYLHFSLSQWIHDYKYLGIHLKDCYINRNAKEDTGPYSISAINMYGDIGCHRVHGKITDAYKFKGKLDNDAVDYFKYIQFFTKEKGVRLIFLPPTLMERNYRDQEKQIDSLYSFMATIGMPYQAKPIRYMFSDSLYSNTPYHMIEQGAVLRTRNVIEDMYRILSLK